MEEGSSGDAAGVSACLDAFSRFYEVVRARPEQGGAVLTALPRGRVGPREVEALARELASRGCYAAARRQGGLFNVYLKVGVDGRSRMGLALALGVLVVASLYASGLALASGAPDGVGGFAWSPWAYVVGLLAPLMVHELGHYVAMRRYGVPSSVPIPLPGPPLQLGFLGTFGSVILMRWTPPTPDALAVVGVAGPLAGFIATLPVAYYGVQGSAVLPPGELPEGSTPLGLAPLAMVLITSVRDVPDGYYLLVSPLAFAAYVMFIVTFLNLIPIGQLDGGHVVRALVGESGHRLASKAFIAALLAASIVAQALLLFALVALGLYMLTGGRHPGPSMGEDRVTRLGVAAAVAYAVLLVLSFPVPVG